MISGVTDMAHPIRAVYSDGQLHLLEPVNLAEGQEIQVLILSERDQLHAALGDLVVAIPGEADDLDEAALIMEIDAGFRNQPPLSETIIEERRIGP